VKRFILTLALVVGSVLAISAPGTASAQYGFYGNFSGGGCNHGHNHVRSFVAPGQIYLQQPYVYGYPPYGYQPYGYGPYGGYGGYGGGYPRGSVNIRW
jgi:hypothetical protein